ncbi:MAG: proprotein convertase P-domain-containing protein [Chloroflexi bacterium]|nr:proprotein convertase P-domain-containing protein [Chloroflexota bacterium]
MPRVHIIPAMPLVLLAATLSLLGLPTTSARAQTGSSLAASAACDPANPDNLLVTITSGDAPFRISTDASASGVPVTVNAPAVHTLQGPDSWSLLTVTEQGAAVNETLILGLRTCANLDGSILIPAGAPGASSGSAGPYPDTLNVSGLENAITDVNVTITGLGHTFPDDVEILLVSPTGAKVVLMNDACQTFAGTLYTFTFDDEATSSLPDLDPCASGAFKPTSHGSFSFPPPAPASPYSTTLGALDGHNPNGVWSLYVNDDQPGDYGDIADWSLDITAEHTDPLVVNIQCDPANLDDLRFDIISGEAPFLITAGPGEAGVPVVANSLGVHTLTGPATWTDIFVTEQGSAAPEQAYATIFTCANLNGSIIIPSVAPGSTIGAASPYPSTRNVTGLGEIITDVNVTITGLGHSAPEDAEIILVSPTGTSVVLMNDMCGSAGGDIYTFTFDDEAASPLPTDDSCTNGSYQASNIIPPVFPPPAPGFPYVSTLSAFDGQNPNGAWKLFVHDDKLIDVGDIVDWSLSISHTAPQPLAVSAQCDPANPDNLRVNISGGDKPFQITALGLTPSVPFTAPGLGTYSLAGPDRWLSLTITEGSGTTPQSLNLGDFTCVNLDGSILIPASPGTTFGFGAASLYPSTITLSGLADPIDDMNVTIAGLGHTFTDDVEIVLVAPNFLTVGLMTDACGGHGGSVYTFTFDDEAPTQLANGEGCVSGTFRPSQFGTTSFTPPGPAGPHGVALSNFDGMDPNGTWSLYIYDDGTGDFGDLAGWSIDITPGFFIGDINRDGFVNISDFSLLAIAFGSATGEPTYNAAADLNDDGFVNISDFSLLAANFGRVS